eukprot:COSAG05_NODE_1612_length_4407_cov_43.627205_3_plen_232_part_00
MATAHTALWDDVQKRDAVNPLEGADSAGTFDVETRGDSPKEELRQCSVCLRHSARKSGFRFLRKSCQHAYCDNCLPTSADDEITKLFLECPPCRKKLTGVATAVGAVPDSTRMLPVLQSAVVRDAASIAGTPTGVVRPGEYVPLLEELAGTDGSAMIRIGDGQYLSRVAARKEQDENNLSATATVTSADAAVRVLIGVFIVLVIANLVWHHRSKSSDIDGHHSHGADGDGH